MNQELSSFAAHLRELIANPQSAIRNPQFSELALELFGLQFKHNAAYRKIREARGLTPSVVEHWTQIPAVPTAAFKELELTSLAPGERIAVFHSSGTTDLKPSRHFHNAGSLAVYEASLWTSFERHILRSAGGSPASRKEETRGRAARAPLLILTPPPAQAPHSSLVHMFETVRQKLDAPESAFVGRLAMDGSWTLDFMAVTEAVSPKRQTPDAKPLFLLGTAFSFVHLLDHLMENDLSFELPPGSRVMETGGYKNRSRTLPKEEMHALITQRLGVPPENIICEYGMSELSSQAYDGARPSPGAAMIGRQAVSDMPDASGERTLLRPGRARSGQKIFHFPPWARIQIVSPETNREVAEGETGLIRVFDLANVFSVAAIQTEDLGIRRGDGFELIGRAQLAEPRGCSLMTA